jgi:hypothetical protein
MSVSRLISVLGFVRSRQKFASLKPECPLTWEQVWGQGWEPVTLSSMDGVGLMTSQDALMSVPAGSNY